MFARPVHRRVAAWLALLAMLWTALVPALAQAAVSSSDRQGWVEVCSSSGVLWVRVDFAADSPASQPGPMAEASAHCPWCPMQGSAGLPVELSPTATVSPQGRVPTAVFTSAGLAAVWSPVQSRAPPAV